MSAYRVKWAGVVPLALMLASCGVIVSPQGRIEAARKDIAAGNWRGASIQLNKVLGSKAYEAQAWQLLTEISLDTGDTRSAQTNMRQALAAGAAGPAVDALRVRSWLAAGQPQAVLDAIAHHTIHLSDPEQSLALARAYDALGQTDRALDTLKSLLAGHPQLPEAHILMGESLARRGAVVPALQEADAAERLDPKSIDAALLAGQLLLARGQPVAAERSLSLAVNRMPPDEPIVQRGRALSTLIEVQLHLGQLDAAAVSQRLLAHWLPGAPMTRLLDARIKLARGNVSDAVSELELLVATAPQFMEARLLLGAELLAAGKPDQAQAQLVAVLAHEPDSLEARELLATAHVNANQPEGALDVLVPVLTAHAPNPKLLAIAGLAAGRLGGADRVLALLSSDDGIDPHDPTLRLNLAQAYLSASRPDLALALLQPLGPSGNLRQESLLIAALRGAEGPTAADAQVQGLLVAQARNPDVLDFAAEYYFGRHDFQTARRLLGESQKIDPKSPATQFDLARLDVAVGDLQAAQSILRSLLALHPQTSAVRIALAQVLTATKAYPEALSILHAAGTSVAAPPAIELATADVYLAEDDLPRANGALDRAIASQAGNPAVADEAVKLLLGARQYAAALKRLDARLASLPGDSGALALKGDAEEGLGNTAAALTAYSQAQKLQPSGALALRLFKAELAAHGAHPEQPLVQWLAHNPRDIFVRGILAQYELETQHLHRAAHEFAAILAQAPDNVVALNNLAWIDDRIGDPSAQQLAERACRLAPDSASINDTLGWILARHGQIIQAVSRLAEAVKLSPDDPDIEYHYAYVLFQRGQKRQVRAILSRVLSKPAPFDSRAKAEQLLAAAKD